jgi:hypothetical protein
LYGIRLAGALHQYTGGVDIDAHVFASRSKPSLKTLWVRFPCSAPKIAKLGAIAVDYNDRIKELGSRAAQGHDTIRL